MIYSEQLVCSPFIMCQIGENQNEFLLFPKHMEHQKDCFSKMIFWEIENNRVVDSLFRVVSFEDLIVIVHYWATTHKEPKSGREGLFTVCGLIVPAKTFKKKISGIIELSDGFFGILDELNSPDDSSDITIEHEEGNNYNNKCQQESLTCHNSVGNYFENNSNSDALWLAFQEKSEELSASIFKKYIDIYVSYNIDSHSSKEEKSFKKRFLYLDARQKGNVDNTIWLETDSNSNRIKVFLLEAHQLILKKKKVDVASICDIFPSSIRFWKEHPNAFFQLLFAAASLEKCTYNGLRYFRLSGENRR